MPLDEVLRDALHHDEPAPLAAAWGEVRARGVRIRRRRRVGRGAAALVTIAALVAGVAALARDDEASVATGPPPMPDVSTEVVAVVGHNRDGDRLVVLDANDGREVRTLAESIGVTNGGVAMSPDGATAYYTRVRQGLPCGGSEIMRVPVDGSAEPEVVVSPGSNPVLSRDGTTLAYSRPSVPADECVSFDSIGVRDLSTGTERLVGGPGAGHTAVPLALSPDGSRIAVGAFEGQSYQAIAILDSTTLGSLVALDLALPADDATFVPDGRLVVALIDESNSRRRLATFDETGAETGTLLETAPTGVTRIGSDASGQLLLHFGGDDLQRWREGDAKPTPIARGVHDAAWIPKVDAAPAPSTTMPPVTIPGPAPLPSSILAARGPRELVELSSTDGSVTRTIPSSTVFGGATFSLRNDGEALLLGDTNGNSCGRTMGQSGGVSIVDTATWEQESIRLPEDVRTAMSATWKPDGTAYAFVQLDCDEAAQLVISPRGNGPDRVFDLSANGEPASGMIAGWDLDGRHIALLVGRTGEPEIEHWIVDTATTGDDLEYRIVPRAEGRLLAPLGSTGRWLVVEEADSSVPRIAELDLTTGASGRTLFTWDGLPPDEIVYRVSADPSGRHLLLLAAVNGGPGPTLYRWSEGDAEPTILAERIDAAAWQPD